MGFFGLPSLFWASGPFLGLRSFWTLPGPGPFFGFFGPRASCRLFWASEPLPSLFWAWRPLLGLFEASGPLPGPLPSLFLTFFWASPFLGFFGYRASSAGLLWASEPLPSTLLGASVILWAFLGFPAFSGPRGLFWAFSKLLDSFRALASCQPFLGLAFWTFSGPGPVLGLLRASSQPFLGFCRLLDLDLFPAFSGPRNLFWAFSLLGLFVGLFPAFSGPRAFSGPFLSFWIFPTCLFLGLPSLFWASGLFWPFVGF